MWPALDASQINATIRLEKAMKPLVRGCAGTGSS